MSKKNVLKTSFLSFAVFVILIFIGFFVEEIVLSILVYALVVADIFLMYVVLQDAKKRNKNVVLFSILAFFLGFIGGFIYYFIISSEKE